MNPGPQPGRVVVVGSANADLTATATALPRPGETVLGHGFSTGRGGKGANQAVAAARAGARCTFLGAVGDDDFAALLRDGLARDGVATGRLRTVPGPSGVALITVDGHGENTIVVVPGANGSLTDLTAAERDEIEGCDAVLAQLEIPVATVAAAARVAAGSGTPFLVNLSPIVDVPDALLADATVALVNETEAQAFGDRLAGTDHVVTTLGGEGVRYRGRFGELTVPAPAVEVVDTVGAGDAFAGTLAAHWVSATDLAGLTQVLRRACAAGALATTVPGASDAAPTADAVDELMATQWWSAGPPGEH